MSSNKQPKLEDQPIGVLRQVNANTFAVRGADPPTRMKALKTLQEQNAAPIANPDKFKSAEIKALMKTVEEKEKRDKELMQALLARYPSKN